MPSSVHWSARATASAVCEERAACGRPKQPRTAAAALEVEERGDPVPGEEATAAQVVQLNQEREAGYLATHRLHEACGSGSRSPGGEQVIHDRDAVALHGRRAVHLQGPRP